MNRRNPFSPPQFPDPWASEWGEDQYGLWQAFIYQNLRLAFRWILPGSFEMGSPTEETGRYDDEMLHTVTLSQGFWLAETTVTQALWQAIMPDNPTPSYFRGEHRPVEQVSWADAQGFIQRFNRLHSDLTARLPWEAEWEYACRAGRQKPFNFEGELSLAKVNYRGTWDYQAGGAGARQETAEVKSYPANDWGLYEMHGNVWEWCQDVWQADLGTAPVTDPWQQPIAPERDASRVIRGGSWSYGGRRVRSAIRLRRSPDDRYNYLGFRLALGHSGSGQEGRAKG